MRNAGQRQKENPLEPVLNDSLVARVRTNIIALMVAFSVMSYFDRIIISIAGPEIIREFSISETEMGAVYSAFLFGYTLTMIPGGRWADRFGPRLVVTLTGLGAALFTGLTALGGTEVWSLFTGIAGSFVAIRFVLGLATGPLYPSCARVYASWIPLRQRARVHGYVAGGAGLGGAISPLLFSWLIGAAGWRMSFVWAAVATAALALLWLVYVRNTPAEHPGLAGRIIPSTDVTARTQATVSPSAPWAQMLKSRNLVLLTLAYFCVCYFEYIFFFWLYYYLGEIRGLPSEETGIATTVVFLAWTVMSPLGGWVSDRLAARFGRKSGRCIIPIACLALSGVCLCVGINLAVEPQQVVPGQTDSTDGRVGLETGVWAVPIVAVEPVSEVLGTLGGGGVGVCVGPLAECGLDEAFGFAVGTGGEGPGEAMA